MEVDIVSYQVRKTNGGPAYYEWTGVEFVARVGALIPPARKHVVDGPRLGGVGATLIAGLLTCDGGGGYSSFNPPSGERLSSMKKLHAILCLGTFSFAVIVLAHAHRRPAPGPLMSAAERRSLHDAPGDQSDGLGGFDVGQMRAKLHQARQTPVAAPDAPASAAPGASASLEACRVPLAPISPVTNASNRIGTRNFPSVFQAWQPASNVGSQHHDLIWHGPDYFHYGCYSADGQGRLTKQQFKGLCTAYLPNTSQDQLPKNDGVVRLAEIRWYDAWPAYLPPDSPFWMNGSPATAAETTMKQKAFRLNDADPCFQKHVAQQCQAAVKAGFDGCLFDRWSSVPDSVKTSLLKQVRAAIGDALIIVNNNGHVPLDLSDLNGVYAEGFGTNFFSPGGTGGNGDSIPNPKPEAWRYLIEDLKTLKGVRQPQINAIEGWGDGGNAEYLRALTALVLVYSNAYVLYSRSNSFQGNPDHTHVWDSFWTQDLGQPLDQTPPDPPRAIPGGAVYRRFSKGIAVYNPTLAPLTVPSSLLSGLHRSHRLNAAFTPGEDVQVPAGDGDIFVQ
jgi:hypothetical protein